MLIAPYNDLDTTMQLVEPVADRLAAIIVEPVQRSLMPKAGFLAGLRRCATASARCLFSMRWSPAFGWRSAERRRLSGSSPTFARSARSSAAGFRWQPWRAGAMCSSSRCRPAQ